MMSKTTPVVAGLMLVVGVGIGWLAAARFAGAAGSHPGDRGGDPADADLAAHALGALPVTKPAASEAGVSVYFSPNGGCTAALLREMAEARESVYVQAAQFTSVSLAKGLIAAHERGVDVRVIVDANKNEDRTQADRLEEAGVPTFTDGKHATAHNKVMIFDHKTVATGSFNFTKDSEQENAENLVFLRDKPAVVTAYEDNFRHHLDHSKKYKR